MKRIDSESSVALTIKAFFSKDPVWVGFEFAERAILAKTSFVKEGPIWIVEATDNKNKIVFVWETVTKYAYPCMIYFPYDRVEVATEIVSETARGQVIQRNDEMTIVWE